MAVELVDRLDILVAVRRFLGMGAPNSRSLRSDSYVRMRHFVRLTTFVLFRGSIILVIKRKAACVPLKSGIGK
jgi:hypothetical protein